MHVIVTVSARFSVTPDGSLFTANGSLGHRFWTRYLDVYDTVKLLVRAQIIDRPLENWHKVSGPGISPVILPYFEGPWQYLKTSQSMKRVIKRTITRDDTIHLRIPDTIATQVFYLLPPERPFGAEVTGDPYDVFAPGAVRHPLRPFFRRWFSRQLRGQCARASAAAYVTEGALQRRYPPAPGAFVTHYSSIELGEDAFASAPRAVTDAPAAPRLLTVGSLAQLYKGPDVLIDTVALCARGGLDLELTIVGDGKHRAELEARTAAAGVGGRVHFPGQLPAGEAVRAQLDRADLFVLPSRTEGLPRALIEAMARALPCLGSSVGGIPELLPAEDRVPPGDAAALAAAIRAVVTDPARMTRMSARNLSKAREYHEDILRERRIAFYRYVKEKTEEWQRRNR